LGKPLIKGRVIKIDKKYHDLHNYHFIRVEDGKRYNIDMVCHRHHFGEYVEIFAENNKSHAGIVWENISCHYPSILESIEKNRNKYKLVKN
jgi:hypothetical protein